VSMNEAVFHTLGHCVERAHLEFRGVVAAPFASGLAAQSAMDAARVVAALPRLSVEQTRVLVRAPFVSAADRVRSECEAFMRCIGSKDTRTILESLAAKRAGS